MKKYLYRNIGVFTLNKCLRKNNLFKNGNVNAIILLSSKTKTTED